MTKAISKTVPLSFFDRTTLMVARDLLGKILVRQTHHKRFEVMITQVEAYDGHYDKASHAHRGKTERNKIMFGEAGYWYIYFVYGMHWMLNIVTGPENYPAAILIRGGIIKHTTDNLKLITVVNGPARLTKFLKINNKINGLPAGKKSGLWIEDRGIKIKNKEIKCTKRIGVDYAGEWAHKLYNFSITDKN